MSALAVLFGVVELAVIFAGAYAIGTWIARRHEARVGHLQHAALFDIEEFERRSRDAQLRKAWRLLAEERERCARL